ncbi:hypothetical protein G6011_07209 [Alternaria panax]|uniref:Uncharacterized protein n=1 Tax=Alternaria panax TaxID=48097 RepID=A0AAD4I4W6_9PLEO|nr:hypothetical protein G6011_07209 [Alternaria panax]
MDLLLFLRKIKQHPSKSAANTSTASGTPTPSPIFSLLVSPESLDAGAIGSAVELGVADELDGEYFDVEKVVADDEAASVAKDTEEEAELDVSLEMVLGDAVGVGVALTLSEPDIVEESAAVVDSDSSADESVFKAPVGSVVTDAVTSVGNASLAGGAAVVGPNSCMK